MACSSPFGADALYGEVTRAAPYRDLSRADFDDTLGFVADGGYALGGYERYRRLTQIDGEFTVAGPKFRQQYRMNIGTIVESPMLNVRYRRGRVLGKVEEGFFLGMVPGDTFVFAGQLLAFERIRETDAEVTPAKGGSPKVPQYMGGRFPLSTHLAERVRGLLADPSKWPDMPPPVEEWLELQRWRSVLPDKDGLLAESFPRSDRHYLVLYCFEGRNAHQTLGMLLTRRMERAGLKPMGFVATDYVLGIWGLEAPPEDLAALLDEDLLGDDLEAWMAESSMLKRTFRNVAVIAGLIERRHPGQKKTGRQVTFNADLIYDVLRAHEPNHILLRATRADAASGLTDIRRLADMLKRVKGKIRHRRLDRVSPLAVPVLLEIGKEAVYGSALDDLVDETAGDLIAEAVSGADSPTLNL
jgi:ATP-dependent Lhr-like helicase